MGQMFTRMWENFRSSTGKLFAASLFPRDEGVDTPEGWVPLHHLCQDCRELTTNLQRPESFGEWFATRWEVDGASGHAKIVVRLESCHFCHLLKGLFDSYSKIIHRESSGSSKTKLYFVAHLDETSFWKAGTIKVIIANSQVSYNRDDFNYSNYHPRIVFIPFDGE